MNLAFVNRIFILFLCLLVFLLKGKANRIIENPQKILIVHLAKLGDMVCATPIFRAVKSHSPGCKLYVMGSATNKEILDGNPDADEYIVYSGNLLNLIRRVRKEKISFACLTGPDFRGLAVLYLSNIPLISAPYITDGFSPYETISYKILRNFVVTRPHQMGTYTPREYLRALEPIGIFEDITLKFLYFSRSAEQNVSRLLSGFGVNPTRDFIVGISPSAGNKVKLWGGEKFAQLASYIYRMYDAKIIIIGASGDRGEINEMLRFLPSDVKIINALGQFNIDELKAVISQMDLFISVDTGPIYIAEAFEVPTIDIVGPVDDREQPPVGKFHKIVKVESRKNAELHLMNAQKYNYKEARRQTDDISVDMVIQKFEELVKVIKK